MNIILSFCQYVRNFHASHFNLCCLGFFRVIFYIIKLDRNIVTYTMDNNKMLYFCQQFYSIIHWFAEEKSILIS